jgi:hypothetical protein
LRENRQRAREEKFYILALTRESRNPLQSFRESERKNSESFFKDMRENEREREREYNSRIGVGKEKYLCCIIKFDSLISQMTAMEIEKQ